jgi:hypothetical protein
MNSTTPGNHATPATGPAKCLTGVPDQQESSKDHAPEGTASGRLPGGYVPFPSGVARPATATRNRTGQEGARLAAGTRQCGQYDTRRGAEDGEAKRRKEGGGVCGGGSNGRDWAGCSSHVTGIL